MFHGISAMKAASLTSRRLDGDDDKEVLDKTGTNEKPEQGIKHTHTHIPRDPITLSHC